MLTAPARFCFTGMTFDYFAQSILVTLQTRYLLSSLFWHAMPTLAVWCWTSVVVLSRSDLRRKHVDLLP